MTFTIIRWHDAMSVEAAELDPRPAVPELAELVTVGWLLAEDDRAVMLGMELASNVLPGRYRFSIPKVSIQERRDYEIGKGFCIKRR